MIIITTNNMSPDNISSSSDEIIYRTDVPNKNDVLCGRGGTINSHPGNEQYRNLVESKKRVYLTARFKVEKRLIATSIVDQIRKMDPPGRFLQKDADSQSWFDIGEEKAREKTSQALRENSKDLRIQMENEYYEAKRQQVREVAIAAGQDPDEAVKGLPTSAADANAQFQLEQQKKLQEQQKQLAHQQQQLALQQQELAKRQQQLVQQQQRLNPGDSSQFQQQKKQQDQQNLQLHGHAPPQWTYNRDQPSLFHTTINQGPGQINLQQLPTHGVAAHLGSFYQHPTDQNQHPQTSQEYSYNHLYGQMRPPQQQEQEVGPSAHLSSQQQMMPPTQRRLPETQQEITLQSHSPSDQSAQQDPMFQDGSFLTSQPISGVRHVQFQSSAIPGQTHPESSEVGGGIPLLIAPKERNRSRKLPPFYPADSTYHTLSQGTPPRRSSDETGQHSQTDSLSFMSGLLTTKTGDSLSYYLQAVEDEISGDVGQEVELVSHGPMTKQSKSKAPPSSRSPKGNRRKHTKDRNHVPSNSGKVQVDWSAATVADEGSGMASSPQALPPQTFVDALPKYPFSPDYSLDLEKMSLADTENISQAELSIGGASLLNVFNDNPLTPLRSLNQRLSLGDASIHAPSLGLSNIGDQDSMMGVSVLLDSSSAMSVESGRGSSSKNSGSRSSSNRSTSPASFSKMNPGVDKQNNPVELRSSQGQMDCKE